MMAVDLGLESNLSIKDRAIEAHKAVKSDDLVVSFLSGKGLLCRHDLLSVVQGPL